MKKGRKKKKDIDIDSNLSEIEKRIDEILSEDREKKEGKKEKSQSGNKKERTVVLQKKKKKEETEPKEALKDKIVKETIGKLGKIPKGKEQEDIFSKKPKIGRKKLNLFKKFEEKIKDTNYKDFFSPLSLKKVKEDSLFSKSKESSNKKQEQSKEKESPEKKEYDSSKLKFHVDNIPEETGIESLEDEFVDKKIKEAPKKKEEREVDKASIKASELVEKHITEGEVETSEDVSETAAEKSQEMLFFEDGDYDEHVFFDDTDFSDRWTPKNSDLTPEREITQFRGKEVGNEEELLSGRDFSLQEFKTDTQVELPKDVLPVKSVKLSDLGFSEGKWEELDFYVLDQPFSYVEILKEKETLKKRYFLVEVDLTEEEKESLEFIRSTLGRLSVETERIEEEGEKDYLEEKVEQLLQEYDIGFSDTSKDKIMYYLEKSLLGLGKIHPLLKDPNIEDISCDGADVPVFIYHREYGYLETNIKFDNEEELSSFVHKLAQKCGKHISIAEPMMDATMPDGSRVQMTLSTEVTSKGSTFTIRKFREDPFSPVDLIDFNTLSAEMMAYFWLAVEHGINVLIAGGTATGKTTMLNALSLFIPVESKIVSIEETREINLPHPNWIPGVSRSGFGEVVDDKMVGEIDLYDLMKAALRQRPEYILVGEIRGREAYVLFQAMSTGHITYSTVHAESASSLIHRLESKPLNIPRIMLQALDVVAINVLAHVRDKRVRRCKQIIEIIDIDPSTKEILTNELFRWDPVKDEFEYSGKSYVLESIRAEEDISKEELSSEIKNRKKLLEWMNKNNIRNSEEVTTLLASYRDNPDEMLDLIESEK